MYSLRGKTQDTHKTHSEMEVDTHKQGEGINQHRNRTHPKLITYLLSKYGRSREALIAFDVELKESASGRGRWEKTSDQMASGRGGQGINS